MKSELKWFNQVTSSEGSTSLPIIS